MKAIVFAEVTDPWSYIGAVRFERAAALYSIITGTAIEISYRAATFNDQNPNDVVSAARISGIDLDLADVVPADSTDAWRVLTWAATVGPQIQRDLLFQLWRAHFLEGADIADDFVVASRAALAGLELETAEALLASNEFEAEVAAQRETAREIGVEAAPFVVVEATHTLSGVRSQDDYLRALQEI